MADSNIGSIIEEIGKNIDNIPAALSGTGMTRTVQSAITRVNNWTGDSIGSVFAEKYWGAIYNFTASNVSQSISNQGVDTEEVVLADFKVKKGSAGGASKSVNTYEQLGMADLKQLGKKMRFKRNM